ncbi:PQQ-binding-like beta-propeller repeat protein [Streptomyces sp. J2-1]|uniref:outer membrane protein assembly factor BamB family protein n=1 Tax=Streptomyces corallincola TaxID=2851888 RepID=UPI001C383135|nr:PQQ-binding-like beta-propeller repeat protein [Streptomyces corallincola]MBV2355551.1 PQQ-binding-like beta-propeller repeat protein [Streptomyces corallincola]
MATSAAAKVLLPLGDHDPLSIGDYRLHAVIGRGGMGTVYLGELARGSRPAAIKTIRTDQQWDTVFRGRFAREVAACRRLGGHSTPAVQMYSLDDDRPWLAIDYVKAPTLKDLVEESGPLPLPAAMALVRELARILLRLADLHLVHRDLKPSNILVTSDGPSLIDFGLVRDIDQPSRALTPMGTLGYAAPEQMRDRGICAATDVYALGAVLLYALTGENPPLDDSGLRVARRADGTPDVPGLPPDAHALAAACMAPEVADRATAPTLLARADRLATAGRGPGGPGGVAGLGARVWLPPRAQEVLERYENVRLPQPGGAPEPRPRRPHTPTRPGPRASGRARTRIAPRWSFALTGHGYYGTPLPYRDRVLVASLDGTVHALDGTTGQPVWSRPLPGRIECGLAATGDTVVVPCADRGVYALDAASGEVRWRHRTGDTAPSTPAAAGPLVCVGDRDGRVTALGAGSGRVRWQAGAGSRAVLAAPALCSRRGAVYAAAWDHFVYAFDASDGTVRWRTATGGELQGGPVVAGDTVLVGSGDRHLYAFDAATGAPRWTFRTEGRVVASPAVHDGLVWAGCTEGLLYGLSPADGTEVRRHSLGAAVRSTPVAHGACLYVGCADGVLHVVRPSTGHLWPWFEADGAIESAVAVAGGLVYVGTSDARVHAVDLGAGRTRAFDGAERP